MDDARGIRLGSIAGTAIYVEISFLILAGLFVLLDVERDVPIERALLWIPILLVGVLFHELGHAATIAALGFGSSRIFLGGFGGVTVNARRSRPWQEILISVAGPVSSLILAFLLSLAFTNIPILRSDRMLRELVPLMVIANRVWAIFNLFPIYPLDGGQILKNFARFFTTEERSVRISAISSLILTAAVLVFAVLSRQFFLAIIAGMLALQNYQRLQSGDREF